MKELMNPWHCMCNKLYRPIAALTLFFKTTATTTTVIASLRRLPGIIPYGVYYMLLLPLLLQLKAADADLPL